MTSKLVNSLISSRILFDKRHAAVLIQIANKRDFSITADNKMRFVQFKPRNGGPQHLGAQITQDGDIFDISAVDPSIPNSLVKFLATGNGIVEKAKRSVTQERA